jgi:hypothetical protein
MHIVKKIDKEQVAEWLQSLTDKEFIEFFYDYLASRPVYDDETGHSDSHLVLAVATRWREDDQEWEPWELDLLCPVTNKHWKADALICQYGEHCGHGTASWAKNSICPVCGGEVYGT